MLTKKIVVTPYNPDWPNIFEQEALKIKGALGDDCIALHHVGSTSIPGLLAKPIIDIVAVVNNTASVTLPLENLGYLYKGEYNIPLRDFFNKPDVNLHVFEEGAPGIELNLLFRDYLREHPEARDEYARLKEDLLKEKSSYEKNNSFFTGYNHGKDSFITKILKAAGYNRVRMVKCAHHAEWEAAIALRQKYFFDPLSIKDPHHEHAHLVLYKGTEIIGYAHIQFWPEHRAALRIIVIDEKHQNQGFDSQFLAVIEKWLKKLKIKSLHDDTLGKKL